MTDMKNTNKLSCEVIQDLMPSYVDGIVSEETAKIINEQYDTFRQLHAGEEDGYGRKK